jgi:hypothetical protein
MGILGCMDADLEQAVVLRPNVRAKLPAEAGTVSPD